MSERTLQITETDPVAVFGPNDQHLRIVREHFPKLNIVARGDTVKVIGPAEVVDVFFERFGQLIQHVAKYNELPRKVLDDIMGNGDNTTESNDEAGVLVHGNAGLRVKARTKNQQRMVEAIGTTDMMLAIGPAGTGPPPSRRCGSRNCSGPVTWCRCRPG